MYDTYAVNYEGIHMYLSSLLITNNAGNYESSWNPMIFI